MGPVAMETNELIEQATEYLDAHGLAVAAVALKLAEMIDSPPFGQAVSPMAKEWRRSIDDLKVILDVNTQPADQDPVEAEARRLKAV